MKSGQLQTTLFIFPLDFAKEKSRQNLGAEKYSIAEREQQKILVEIKSFITSSNINELNRSIGQYDFYSLLLEEKEPDRIPFGAMPKDAYEDLIARTHHSNFFE
jgi:XisH protein